MANYNKATNFTAKDTLPTGNPSKIVKGAEIDTEFTAISNAIASKADTNSPSFTGTIAVGGALNVSGALVYTSTLTGGTGIVNLGSGQFIKDASGNIGIGATSTGAQLYQYLASGTTQHTKQNGSVIALDYASTASGAVAYGSFSNHPVIFTTNNAERMRLTAAGKLEVVGEVSASGLLTTNLTAQGTASASNFGLGFSGQTWNNLTGSRSLGTTYTNSRAYPIMVNISIRDTVADKAHYFAVNGANVAQAYIGTNINDGVLFFTAIVPPSATYSAAVESGGTINIWSELY